MKQLKKKGLYAPFLLGGGQDAPDFTVNQEPIN